MKVGGHTCSDAFERRLGFSFTVRIVALNNILRTIGINILLLRCWSTKLAFNFVCIATCLLVTNLYSHDLLVTSLCILIIISVDIQ